MRLVSFLIVGLSEQLQHITLFDIVEFVEINNLRSCRWRVQLLSKRILNFRLLVKMEITASLLILGAIIELVILVFERVVVGLLLLEELSSLLQWLIRECLLLVTVFHMLNMTV